jgi:hypothetical protein
MKHSGSRGIGAGQTRARGARAVVGRAAVAAVTALAGLTELAWAAPPIETTTRLESFACEPVTGDRGAVAFSGSLSGEGPDVYIAVWDPGSDPTIDPPTLQSDESFLVDRVSWDRGVVLGTVPMIHAATGEPAGEATVEAELTAEPGETTTTERAPTRDWHNQRVYQTAAVQPAVATASVVLPGGGERTFPGCPGAITTIRTWTTQPDASVQRLDPAVFFECSATHPSGQSVFMAVEGGLESAIWLERKVPGDDEPSVIGFSLEATSTRTSVTSTVPLYAPPDFEPAGDALLEASLTRSGQRRFVLTHQDGKKTMVVEDLTVAGTVRFPDGTVFSFTGCSGERNTSHEVLTDPAGPRPGGPAPSNDRPDGAIALAPGGSRTDQSRGAAPAAEVPLWCHDNPPYPEEQTGNTLWYTVEGTGRPLTVDTAGSSFNTVLGVYARQGDVLVEIACVDDLFGETLQARGTFPTEAGQLYLAQVGGYAGQFGNIRVTLR